MADDQSAHDAFIAQEVGAWGSFQPGRAGLAVPAGLWVCDHEATSGPVAWGSPQASRPPALSRCPRSCVEAGATPSSGPPHTVTDTLTGDEAVGWLDDIQWKDPKQYATVKAQVARRWADLPPTPTPSTCRTPGPRSWTTRSASTPATLRPSDPAGHPRHVRGGPGGCRFGWADHHQVHHQVLRQGPAGPLPVHRPADDRAEPGRQRGPGWCGERRRGSQPVRRHPDPGRERGRYPGHDGRAGPGGGGQDPSDRAKQNPQYGAYQAATTYYNALLQLLGPAVSTGEQRVTRLPIPGDGDHNLNLMQTLQQAGFKGSTGWPPRMPS